MLPPAILRYPDPRLRQRCAPVTSFDTALAERAQALLAAMRAAPGVGITAAHVGWPERLVVLELTPEDGPRFYVNPQIVFACEERARHIEGSVSMPGATDEVERAAMVRVRYQDLSGETREETAEGFAAACHQHEIDQLDGIFWLDRLSRLKRERLVKRWEKAQRG